LKIPPIRDPLGFSFQENDESMTGRLGGRAALERLETWVTERTGHMGKAVSKGRRNTSVVV